MRRATTWAYCRDSLSTQAEFVLNTAGGCPMCHCRQNSQRYGTILSPLCFEPRCAVNLALSTDGCARFPSHILLRICRLLDTDYARSHYAGGQRVQKLNSQLAIIAYPYTALGFRLGRHPMWTLSRRAVGPRPQGTHRHSESARHLIPLPSRAPRQ